MKSVAIIGAGPVGLYTAVQFKSKFPNTDVYLYEKHQERKRSHILLLKKSSIRRFPKPVIDDLWGRDRYGCYVQSPSMTKSAKCYVMKKSGMDASVVVSTLEHTLRAYALELGVEIIEHEVHLEDLETIANSVDLLIGADGKDSIVAEFLGSTQISDDKHRYGLCVTFEYEDKDHGPERTLARSPQHRYRAFRSNETDSKGYKGYLGINISEKEYNDFQEDHDEGIETTVETALNYYGFQDVYNINAWPIVITPYRETKVSECKFFTKIYLVGNAATGTHFFTGTDVNDGFDSVMFLVDNMLKYGNSVSVCERYKSFIDSMYELNEENIDNVTIEFDRTLQKCLATSEERLNELAKDMGIRDPHIIPYNERCYLLASVLKKR